MTLSGALTAAAVLIPQALKYVHRVWMMLGNILGWINTRIILGLIYYVIITPIRFAMKLAGHDPMNRKLDSGTKTYRVLRKSRPASHMKHQF